MILGKVKLMKYCYKCGTQLDDSYVYCGKCGTAQPDANKLLNTTCNANDEKAYGRTKILTVLGAVLVLLVVLVILLIVFMKEKNNKSLVFVKHLDIGAAIEVTKTENPDQYCYEKALEAFIKHNDTKAEDYFDESGDYGKMTDVSEIRVVTNQLDAGEEVPISKIIAIYRLYGKILRDSHYLDIDWYINSIDKRWLMEVRDINGLYYADITEDGVLITDPSGTEYCFPVTIRHYEYGNEVHNSFIMKNQDINQTPFIIVGEEYNLEVEYEDCFEDVVITPTEPSPEKIHSYDDISDIVISHSTVDSWSLCAVLKKDFPKEREVSEEDY